MPLPTRLRIRRPTVRRFLAAERFPERLSGPKRQRQSIVASYLPFLRERGPAGCHNGRQLFREAQARGYSGSPAQLERVATKVGASTFHLLLWPARSVYEAGYQEHRS